MLKSIIDAFVGHHVIVKWEGVTKVHHARTEAECLEWAACYSSGSALVRRNLTNLPVAYRRVS